MAFFFICVSGFLMGLCVWGVVSGLVNPLLAVIVVGGEFALIYVNLKNRGKQIVLPKFLDNKSLIPKKKSKKTVK
jgi:pilus assembly protein TadC